MVADDEKELEKLKRDEAKQMKVNFHWLYMYFSVVICGYVSMIVNILSQIL